MAEEEDLTDQEAMSEENSRPTTAKHKTDTAKNKKKQKNEKPFKNKCRSRIDELALPARRLVLDLYQNHSYHLEKERVEKVKALLQELYAMTPEETERYFANLREKNDELAKRKDIKYTLRRLVRKRNKERLMKKAYDHIFVLLQHGMKYAATNPVPPLVSIRLRNLSNIILEQLCDLRNVDIPSREHPSQIGSFFIAVSDWIAIAIEYLYFGVQRKKNEELEKIEKEFIEKDIQKKPKQQREDKQESKDAKRQETPGDEAGEKTIAQDEAVLSEPLLVSEME